MIKYIPYKTIKKITHVIGLSASKHTRSDPAFLDETLTGLVWQVEVPCGALWTTEPKFSFLVVPQLVTSIDIKDLIVQEWYIISASEFKEKSAIIALYTMSVS